MQEVFEKNINEKVLENAWQPLGMFDEHSPLVIKVSDVKEIVKQEAEKCKSIYMDGEYCWQSCWCTDRCGECNRLCNGDIDYYESYDAINNGWITSSESFPYESGYYLVTYHEWSNGDYLPKFDDTYVRRLYYQRSEHFAGWNYKPSLGHVYKVEEIR